MKAQMSRGPAYFTGLTALLAVLWCIWARFDGEAEEARDLLEPIQRVSFSGRPVASPQWATSADMEPARWVFRMRCTAAPCEPQNVYVEYLRDGQIIATYSLCEARR